MLSPVLDMTVSEFGDHQSVPQTAHTNLESIGDDLDFTSIFLDTGSGCKTSPFPPQQPNRQNSMQHWTGTSLDEEPFETASVCIDEPSINLSSSWEPISEEYPVSFLNSVRIPSVAQVENAPRGEASLLSNRKIASTTSCLNAMVALGILKSYPRMILEGSLPPFLHNCHFIRKDGDAFSLGSRGDICFPEPLANCKSILHMFYAKTKESSAFVWRTIRSEQRRLRREV